MYAAFRVLQTCLFLAAVDALLLGSDRLPTSRRHFFASGVGSLAVAITAPKQATAAPKKDRTQGYSVQRSERDWSYVLSGQQYNILRVGGTEAPFSSVLESEKRPGTFVCAGCGTPLFASDQKFNSGTGWPSFAKGLPGEEVEAVGAVVMTLLGAEVRCGTCGGHLGDVFGDGKAYPNTPAFATGQRHCIDGAALVFKPADGSPDVYGDVTPPPKPNALSKLLEGPVIKERSI